MTSPILYFNITGTDRGTKRSKKVNKKQLKQAMK